MTKRRSNKKLTQEDIESIESFNITRKSENNVSNNIFTQIKIDVKPKTENQKRLLQAIKENEIIIASGFPGTGKAQPLHSKILTPNGWVTMGEIDKGDYVITPKGISTKVLDIFPQGEKKIYKITFSDGRTVESCDEHLWKVFYKGWKEKYRVLTLKEIMEKHHKKMEEGTLYIPLIESSSNIDIELPMNPYLLGCLIGDGGMTNNTLTFSNKDEEVLEFVDSELNNYGYHLNKLKYGNYDYNISSIGVIKTSGKKGQYTNLIKETLNELNLYGKRSEEKFIPEIYKKASKNQKIQLIQGLMDTDGTTDARQCSVSYSTSSKKLCDDFVELIHSIGGIVNVRERKPKYTYNGEVKEGLTNYNIYIRYHNPKDLFSLSRKKNICEKYQYKDLKLGIENIEYVGEMEAKCIMVEDSDHLYITDNYIVTHNTFLACAEALKLLKNHELPFKKIILVKSVTTLKDEEIGFLKGTMEEKMEPFMDSFLDNFNKIIGENLTNKLREMKYIEIKPIAYVRGRSIDNSIIIMDEAQNISIDNMRTLMTRIGENSKMVILGDIKQKDIRNKKESSLEVVIERFKEKKGFGIVELRNPEDIVRNPIIKVIEDIFDQIEEEKGNNGKKQILKD